MSKYNVGDKFIVEIESIYNEKLKELYKVKGFNALVFDDNGLDKLQKINPEFKIEDIDDMLAEYDIKQESYNKGLQDSWEFLDKLAHEITKDVREKVFGYTELEDVLDHYSYQEALAKIEAYEKEQSEICVGDVVRDEYGKNLCVTRVSEDKSVVECFGPGGMMHRYSYNCVTKTDKHLDIMILLNQIGE